MDIRKIALSLSWKTPPDYKQYSRLKFFELLETQYGIDTTKANFYWEQANKYEEEFYQLVLEYLQQKSTESDVEEAKFNGFLDKLWILERVNVLTWLKELREDLKLEENSQRKWKKLEIFLGKLFSLIDWISVVATNLNNWDEELDLVLQNNHSVWFFSNINSPLILVEAKNWKDNVPTKVSRDFGMKCHLHKNLSRVWILVAVNWVTWEVDELLKRLWSTDEVLVIISWEDIDELFLGNIEPAHWLMKLFTNSLK